MMKAGAFSQLEAMSREQGRKMDSPESVKDILRYLRSCEPSPALPCPAH
jgi:hypothetical protein